MGSENDTDSTTGLRPDGGALRQDDDAIEEPGDQALKGVAAEVRPGSGATAPTGNNRPGRGRKGSKGDQGTDGGRVSAPRGGRGGAAEVHPAAAGSGSDRGDGRPESLTEDKHANITANFLFDRYQRAILHPDYRCFCDTYRDFFDDQGEFDNLGDYGFGTEMYDEFLKLRKRFGLSHTLFHYNKDFTPEDMLCLPLFESPFTVKGHWVTESESQGVQEISPVHDKHYTTVTIDIDAGNSLERILNEVKGWVEFARTAVEETQSVKKQRFRPENNQVAFSVYRKWHIDKMNLKDIAIALELQTRGSAYDKLKAAHRLIGIAPPADNPSDKELALEGRWDEIGRGKSQRELPLGNIELVPDRKNVDGSQPLLGLDVFLKIIRSTCEKCPDDICKNEVFKKIETHSYENLTNFFKKKLGCEKLKNVIQSHLTFHHS